jgi:hypothetical protein
MKLHALSTNHAKQIVVRLLKTVIFASKPPLKLAEVEGDAVFFYAPSSPDNLKKTSEQVKSQVLKFFQRFNEEIEILKQMNLCSCDACAQVGKLQLKQVIHQGDVSIEKIERFEKLFGLDVIIVHRMLKNSVPSHEYVMMTDESYKNFEDFYGVQPERRVEQFEGVGDVETLVFYPAELLKRSPSIASETPSLRRVPLSERVMWTSRLVARTVMDLLGIAKVKGTFDNLPT